MSADNGIYILETPKGNGKEYRVAHLLSIEDVDWDSKRSHSTNDDDIRIINARGMWKDVEVFTDEIKSIKYAHKLHDTYGWTEYGVCIIKVDREFEEEKTMTNRLVQLSGGNGYAIAEVTEQNPNKQEFMNAKNILLSLGNDEILHINTESRAETPIRLFPNLELLFNGDFIHLFPNFDALKKSISTGNSPAILGDMLLEVKACTEEDLQEEWHGGLVLQEERGSLESFSTDDLLDELQTRIAKIKGAE